MYTLVRTLALVAALATGASAASILRYDYTFNNLPGDFVQNFTLPQFNAGGNPWTLTGIDFLITIDNLNATLDVTNITEVENEYTVSLGSMVSLYDTSALPALVLLSRTVPLIPPTTFNLAPEATRTVTGNTSSSSTDPCPTGFTCTGQSYSVPIPVAILAQYTGSGVLPFRLRGNSVQSVSGGLHDTDNASVRLSGTASILYTYETPEPGTLVLLGSALIGLALMGDRKSVV